MQLHKEHPQSQKRLWDASTPSHVKRHMTKIEDVKMKTAKQRKSYANSAPRISIPSCIICKVDNEYLSIRSWNSPMIFLRQRTRGSLIKP